MHVPSKNRCATVIVEENGAKKIRAKILCACMYGIDTDAKRKIAVRAGFSTDLLTSI